MSFWIIQLVTSMLYAPPQGPDLVSRPNYRRIRTELDLMEVTRNAAKKCQPRCFACQRPLPLISLL